MADRPQQDSVLDSILDSGAFLACLRSGCGAGSGAALALFLLSQYPGLTEPGAEYLAEVITQAREAVSLLMQPAITPQDVLTAIPLIGPPVAELGLAGQLVYAAELVTQFGPDSEIVSQFATLVSSEPLSIDQLKEQFQEAIESLRGEYDENWSGDQRDRFSGAMQSLIGIYRQL